MDLFVQIPADEQCKQKILELSIHTVKGTKMKETAAPCPALDGVNG